jgi:hypothetical protein
MGEEALYGFVLMVQDLHNCQRSFEEIRQENIKLQQRQEESDSATVLLRREQASLQRILESKEVNRTAPPFKFQLRCGISKLQKSASLDFLLPFMVLHLGKVWVYTITTLHHHPLCDADEPDCCLLLPHACELCCSSGAPGNGNS